MNGFLAKNNRIRRPQQSQITKYFAGPADSLSSQRLSFDKGTGTYPWRAV